MMIFGSLRRVCQIIIIFVVLMFKSLDRFVLLNYIIRALKFQQFCYG
jgi:hypothetical protein